MAIGDGFTPQHSMNIASLLTGFANRNADAKKRALEEQLLSRQIAGQEQAQDVRRQELDFLKEDRGLALEDRERGTNADLMRALQLQDAIDIGRESGGLTEQDVALINASGGGDEQFAMLNSLFAAKQGPTEIEQAELAATQALAEQRRAAAEKDRRGPAAPAAPTDIRILEAIGLDPTLENVTSLRRAGASQVNVGTKAPSGFEYDPDNPGTLRPQKGGPKDPNVLSNLTEAQAKSRGFAERAEASFDVLDEIGAPTGSEAAGSVLGSAAGFLPGLFSDTAGSSIENAIRSEDAQRREQAELDFVTAVLRKESGAAISDNEFENEARKFFPLATDSPKTVEQKRQSRQRAIANLQREGAIDPDEFGINARESRDEESPARLDSAKISPADLDNMSDEELDALERSLAGGG